MRIPGACWPASLAKPENQSYCLKRKKKKVERDRDMHNQLLTSMHTQTCTCGYTSQTYNKWNEKPRRVKCSLCKHELLSSIPVPTKSQAWWHMPTTPALERYRQKDPYSLLASYPSLSSQPQVPLKACLNKWMTLEEQHPSPVHMCTSTTLC